ncbi:hypothetical protein EU971_02755 [Yersinia pseudotuberculosis]|nr:hypothetical protein EU971_02755 [Yersinia pseudotuberculosis]
MLGHQQVSDWGDNSYWHLAPGAELNANCSNLVEASPINGTSNKSSQHTCSLKYDGYNDSHSKSPI